MRKFSGISNIHYPEAKHSDNMPSVQIMISIEKDGSPTRIAMNIQPYRTEFRNIYK